MGIAPIIVALDGMNEARILQLARQLETRVWGMKLNSGLYTSEGVRLVGQLADLGFRVMADTKMHDIPQTAENTAKALAAAGATLITAHAAGGEKMLRAAVAGAFEGSRDSGQPASILAITVLTSLTPAEVKEACGRSVEEEVIRLARRAKNAGCTGIVCSPLELDPLSEIDDLRSLWRVTPGIREPGSPPDDQHRTATPREARKKGAALLVIGRPICQASDPVAAVERITASLAG